MTVPEEFRALDEIAGLKSINADLSAALEEARAEGERLRGELASARAEESDMSIRVRFLRGEAKFQHERKTDIMAERDEARRKLGEARELLARWLAEDMNEVVGWDSSSQRWVVVNQVACESAIDDTGGFLDGLAADAPKDAAPATDPRVCTHPKLDDRGDCVACGENVGLGVPVEFARFNARMMARAPKDASAGPEAGCGWCGGPVGEFCPTWPGTERRCAVLPTPAPAAPGGAVGCVITEEPQSRPCDTCNGGCLDEGDFDTEDGECPHCGGLGMVSCAALVDAPAAPARTVTISAASGRAPSPGTVAEPNDTGRPGPAAPAAPVPEAPIVPETEDMTGKPWSLVTETCNCIGPSPSHDHPGLCWQCGRRLRAAVPPAAPAADVARSPGGWPCEPWCGKYWSPLSTTEYINWCSPECERAGRALHPRSATPETRAACEYQCDSGNWRSCRLTTESLGCNCGCHDRWARGAAPAPGKGMR